MLKLGSFYNTLATIFLLMERFDRTLKFRGREVDRKRIQILKVGIKQSIDNGVNDKILMSESCKTEFKDGNHW